MKNLQRYFFKFYYIGNERYYGSQRQKSKKTIENTIIDVLIRRNYIKNIARADFESASRTDRYVSARGAVFSISTQKNPILMEINSILPKDIGIYAYTKVKSGYSPRYDAILRHYKYIYKNNLNNHKNQSKLDIDLLKKACQYITGQHDFKNFHKRSKKKVLTVRDLEFVDFDIINDVLIFDFKSRGFLRQQIRRIVQKLIEVATHKITFKEFLALFETEEYISYKPANPKGLILWDIEYDHKIKFEMDKKSIERMNSFFKINEEKSFLSYNLFRIMQKSNLCE